MNIENVIKDIIINFDGKVAVYYDDFKGTKIKINEKEKYNAASCIKIFILIELFNQINNGSIKREQELMWNRGRGQKSLWKMIFNPVPKLILKKNF